MSDPTDGHGFGDPHDPDPDLDDDELDPQVDDPGPAGDADAEDVGAALDAIEAIDALGAVGTDEAIDAIETAERVRDASKRAIEALVMVAEDPLPSNLLGQLLEVSPVVVDRLCEELAQAYDDEGRGFQLVRVAGGWRYQSHPDQSVYVERFVLQGQTGKLSVAALETLAIVAYKQPVSRAQVASIRGVSVDGVMRTLEQRGYIAEIGKDPGPGQAVLFGTTPLFLEKVGLDNIDELPPLGDFVPGADVVEQLEQGLRPDRMPLRPEDATLAGNGVGPGSSESGEATGEGDDDAFAAVEGDFGGDFDLMSGMGEIAGITLDGEPGVGSGPGGPGGIDLRDGRVGEAEPRPGDDGPADDE